MYKLCTNMKKNKKSLVAESNIKKRTIMQGVTVLEFDNVSIQV